jgi:hypothetical protein
MLSRGLVALLAIAVSSPLTSVAASSVPVPTEPRLPAAIEPLAPYQPEKFCRTTVEPGVKDFETVLTSTYTDTVIVSDLRPCEKHVVSEHFDGRAVDWGVDHRVASQRADGQALLRWLFAPDADGNRDAMLRRLGIMYIIWNKRIWGSWDQHWAPYFCQGPTACHVDHMHFSFDWAGAEAKTSWFTGRVGDLVGYPAHHAGRHAHAHVPAHPVRAAASLG